MKKKSLIRNIICVLLIFSIELSSAQSNIIQQQQAQQQEDETQTITIVVGAIVVFTAALTFLAIGFSSKAKKQAAAEEAKFQACVGKTKADVYTIYGPPDSIVDDGQGQGGSILEYHTIVTSGDGNGSAWSTTYRKLFYVNKDNIVTAVKEDSR